MRVLHVVKGLGPGGAERLLVSLSGVRRPDLAFDVAYVLPQKDHLVGELVETGAATHLLAGRRGLADPRWPVRLVRLVRSIEPDVVHLHSPAVAAVARPLLRALPGRRVVVSTEHNVWSSFDPISRWANAATLPLSDARLAVSDEVRASVGARHRATVEVSVQGIPLSTLTARRQERAAARAALGLRPHDVLVATVANFREKKDYPTLLEAASLCADHPHLQFVAIGQGPLEADLHALHARLQLGTGFRFLGYHPDPPGVLAGADLFTLTSRHEGLPIALLEAMALEVAPVVSAVGGIPQVITDGLDGVLLPPGDPDGFARAFRDLADAPARRKRLGEAAGQRADAFDIARTEEELEALYARLLALP